MRVFAFVAAQKADFPVRTLCRVCRVSTSGFYAYAARKAGPSSPSELASAEAARHIAWVHKSSRRRYGSPRVTAQLAREGIPVNHKAVEAEMVRQGLQGRSSRRKMRTTRRDPSKVPALDLVQRYFERANLDQLWIGDATYISTSEGWPYLATVIDACSCRLLGWSITDHLRTELCLDAIEAGVATRGGRRNLAGVSCSTETTAAHIKCIPGAPRAQRHPPVALETPPVLGQRHGRELVLDAQRRAHLPPVLANPFACSAGNLRVHPGLLQPPAAAQLTRQSHPGRIREAQDELGPQGNSSGIINLSVETGQSHSVSWSVRETSRLVYR